MKLKIKIPILIIVIWFFSWFLFEPISQMGLKGIYSNPPEAGQKITAPELKSFLDLWSRMQQSELKDILGQMSLRSNNEYPAVLVKWLEAQQWNVERFFYNEQRLHGLIDYVNLNNSLKSNIALSKTTGANLKEVIENQQQRMSSCPYDEDEMMLINNNLYQITEIFAGRAVLSK